MPRSFDLSADYDGSVEAVHRAFTDETYWRARLAASGVDVAVLESMRAGGDTVEVVTVQVIHSHKLPGMVTQLHVGDLRIRREETWGPVADGAAQGSVVGSILDAPVNLAGTAMLSPIHETGGARLSFRATVQVRVPIIGGKLENIIGTRLAELVAVEQRFTEEWIGGTA
ncbi:DUF2505 domain-containing protein [Mycobacterium paraseoulense]|uniref:DUF2505 domain-containing protein n=1 Tax=Mycobacterium paraseoulense TaxID=590652 RepID=A0A1X0IAD5_9MYCO|nr:DUF2505 domain-containing protein [Mycobacterium paraseoulense]MCV7398215.1 DUF2505 domain-containing protein [Mycobacterium paraseoulense]ORB40404.1 hypothetical protein BST39_13840 [Mycobacterium paraseoulense]BBZ73328.1 hypothetical protein MPRS_44210 [Mycobacterium paraseoulense]